MWQKCPICEGSGKQNNPYQTTAISEIPCSVCGGMKIISTLNGKPPQHDVESAEPLEVNRNIKSPFDGKGIKFC